MIEAKVGGNVGCHMTVEGDLKQITDDCCNIVLAIYVDLRREDPETADLFRAVISGVLAEENPIWDKADKLFTDTRRDGEEGSFAPRNDSGSIGE
jgi:hypothetical protein